ncbi:hypothetical protein OE749_12160 [Aestuariibacter sp. AA17]|uniref:Uncharacterized protein n=1 Tax=Fluctibacter corallii TaxID=2984329 RepID=A0ABT3A9T8_9ALTE|nr:hypothetical protein [Aestuariibacter sp. AA17]MCV2885449.1 hypothetical protein [Aestuariibacter sp. AA17]
MKFIQDADNIVKGKRCIVLASSGYLKGRGKISKAFIDSFDLVVKVSDMCEIPDKNNELGSRCDVWFGLPKIDDWTVDLQAIYKQNVKLMVFQPKLPHYESTWDDCVDWFEKQSHPDGVAYTFASASKYKALTEKLGCMPFSGIFAVMDLLSRGAEQVFAYGHDFFQSGYFKESEIYDVIDSGWHLLEPQKKYLANLLEVEPRFSCDLNTKSLLHLWYSQDVSQNDRYIDQLLGAESDHFFQNLTGNVLVFRSCNEIIFGKILENLCEKTQHLSVDVVCQNAFKPQLTCQNLRYIAVEKQPFNNEEIVNNKVLSDNYSTCVIPYNGIPLLHYLPLFEVALKKSVKQIILVNTRGAMKRYFDVQGLVNRCQKYASIRSEFRCLQDRFDRKGAF